MINSAKAFDDASKMYQISGDKVERYLLQAMKMRDVYAFEYWFNLIGGDPNAITQKGDSVWMLWNKEVRESNQRLDQSENEPITNLLRDKGADDCDFLLKLYARGGVELLLKVASMNCCDLNARDARGLRVLDRIALPTHLGRVYGKPVHTCTPEEVVRLRETGFRFGYQSTGDDTIWCRARRRETDPLPLYWKECVEDVLELGIAEDTDFAVTEVNYDDSIYSSLYSIPPEIEGEDFAGHYEDYCKYVAQYCEWGSRPMTLRQLIATNGLLMKVELEPDHFIKPELGGEIL